MNAVPLGPPRRSYSTRETGMSIQLGSARIEVSRAGWRGLQRQGECKSISASQIGE